MFCSQFLPLKQNANLTDYFEGSVSPSISKSINMSTGSLTIREIVLGVLDLADLSGCKGFSTMCLECLSG